MNGQNTLPNETSNLPLQAIRDDEDLEWLHDWKNQDFSPPEPIVERLAWTGRLTVLAARSGVGKSTLLGGAVAAASWGATLFGERETVRPSQPVLYCGMEEHKAELQSRLLGDFQVNPRNVVMHCNPAAGSALESLVRTARLVEPSLIVVDSLQQLAVRSGIDTSGADGWAQVTTPLMDLAHGTDTATIVLHHGRKRDGRYRGSSVIANTADVLLEMRRGEGENERRIEVRTARWDLDDFTVALDQSEQPYSYHIVEGGD